MWQPEITYAARIIHDAFSKLIDVKADASEFEGLTRTMLIATGALSEINRLTALLAMKDETIKTLREQVLQDTATFADDYDSGYRAA